MYCRHVTLMEKNNQTTFMFMRGQEPNGTEGKPSTYFKDNLQ